MKPRLWSLVALLQLGGCANHILVDRLEGQSHLAGGRIATLGLDRPGNLSAGASATLQNPPELRLRGPTRDSSIAGIQEWALPRWTLGGHLVWTPWEGVTLSPEVAAGLFEHSSSARLAMTIGLHADTDVLRWQLEGRAGLAWSRSSLVRRTLVSDPSETSEVYLDSSIREDRIGWSPQVQGGIQLESAFPRQAFQLWALGRWSLLDAALLEDAPRDAVSVEFVQVAQAGAGFHRAIGRTHTLTAGVVHGWAFSGTDTRPATTTGFVMQWEVAILPREAATTARQDPARWTRPKPRAR